MGLTLKEARDGIVLAVHGSLDLPAAAELETILLLEASLQPSWAILDLGAVDGVHPCVEGRLSHWLRAFADVGSQLLICLPGDQHPHPA